MVNGTLLRFCTNNASLRDATSAYRKAWPIEYAVWLPLRVFERLARSPTYFARVDVRFTLEKTLEDLERISSSFLAVLSAKETSLLST